MKNKVPECIRCGKCCLADMTAFVSGIEEEDIKRWKNEGRYDILHIIDNEHSLWAGDHIISSQDGRYIHGCHFLSWDEEHYSCSIYETRPIVCRNFKPGSSALCSIIKK
jgi:Fe-S-cluster containining protein